MVICTGDTGTQFGLEPRGVRYSRRLILDLYQEQAEKKRRQALEGDDQLTIFPS